MMVICFCKHDSIIFTAKADKHHFQKIEWETIPTPITISQAVTLKKMSTEKFANEIKTFST